MKIEAKYLDCLKEAVEKTVGKKMNTPRDFDLLSIYVYNLTNEHLSSTTLKRLWDTRLTRKNLRRAYLRLIPWPEPRASRTMPPSWSR